MEQATKIENSFSFFFRMFPPKSYLFYYVGDLDASGYGIFERLKEKYPDCCIQPALKIYRKMLQCFEQRNDQKPGQTDHPKAFQYRDSFFQWFTEEEQALLRQLWAGK